MISFGLVTEGITDQEIISNILSGYFDNPDILVNELQPLRDETDRNKSTNFGGWGNLLEYCKSDVFKSAFQTTSFIIIHIDTDICEDYNVSKKQGGIDLSVNQLVDQVKNLFIEIIGPDFYEKNSKRIIFAIAVHSIECWLLPIYYNDHRKNKIVNCRWH